MDLDIVYSITKEINNIYKELSVNGLNISIEEKNNLIINLKELISKETKIYNNLTYDEISEIRDYFDINYTEIGAEISERIINKIDELIMTKYIDEFYLEYADEDFDEEDKKYDRYSLIYINTLKRDLFYLKIYFFNKIINNEGHIGNDIYLNDFIIKQSINSNIFTHCSLFPYIENEVIKNNFIVNDCYINSKLVCQLSLFDEFFSKTYKTDTLKIDFIDRLNRILKINEENIFELDNAITLLDSLVHILGVLILDKDYLKYINKSLEEEYNSLIYYILYDNLNEFSEDKKNIKVLTLNNFK